MSYGSKTDSLPGSTFSAVIVPIMMAAIVVSVFLMRERNYATPPQFAATPLINNTGSKVWFQTHETTIAEWNLCFDAGVCSLRLRPPNSGDPDYYPATGINWLDALDYVRWISAETGHPFRLPRQQEWYAMAADVLPDVSDPIFKDASLTWASTYLLDEGVDRRLKNVGTWSTNAYGVTDLSGNVWEWTQDCYDGRADTTADNPCAAYVLGGEHRAVVSFLVRDPARGGCAVGAPPAHIGVRLVTDQAPQVF